jgi:hypothetical protein
LAAEAAEGQGAELGGGRGFPAPRWPFIDRVLTRLSVASRACSGVSRFWISIQLLEGH